MPSFFDFFKNPISITPPDKNCQNCFYSEHKGITCFKGTLPSKILNPSQAVVCEYFTTTQPVYDSQTETAILGNQIKTITLQDQSLGEDNTHVSSTPTILTWALIKTLTLNVATASKQPDYVLYNYYTEAYVSGALKVKVTLESDTQPETQLDLIEGITSTVDTFKKVDVPSAYKNYTQLKVRLYVYRDSVDLGAGHDNLQVYGSTIQQVNY